MKACAEMCELSELSELSERSLGGHPGLFTVRPSDSAVTSSVPETSNFAETSLPRVPSARIGVDLRVLFEVSNKSAPKAL
jgi:hypothetical protein